MKLFSFLFVLFTALFIVGCAPKGTFMTPSVSEQEVKIAMILPDKLIGRYAHTTSTAVFAYFVTRERPFMFKTFQIDDESQEEIERVLDEIKEQGFQYVIAPVTPQGARVIVETEETLAIYFPTIHKNDLASAPENIYFGAIDYRAQIEKLTPFASSPLVIMYDKSVQGEKLLELTKKDYLENGKPFHTTSRQKSALEDKTPYDPSREPKEKHVIAYGVDKRSSSLKPYFNNNEKIQYGTLFLNTPLIKSTMILSQLTIYNAEVTNALSTQINYDPLLLSMTQKRDRNNLYIANSISMHDDTLIQANALLSNDIVYDWINYASTIGADLFYHQITGEERIYDLPVVDNQVVYPVSIVQPSGSHFTVVKNGELP
ncbi:MAG: hypothetical protein PF439_08335 [Helicobacteraceae bacterium]|jgi:hypothetical protein|nr:hypothetical protein [Helicobacteraceae bacterium]